MKNSSGTTLETMGYDGLGRLITQTVSGTTTDRYYSDQDQVLEEMVGGSAVARYVWSPVYVNAMILRDAATGTPGTLNQRLWVQQDANWNVTALVNSSGVVVERYVYSPFGVQTIYNAGYTSVLSSSGYNWVYGFQGMRFDSLSGLNESQSRWYSPALQRWTTVDPMGFSAGDDDLYRFVGINPGHGNDASGLQPADGAHPASEYYYKRVVPLDGSVKLTSGVFARQEFERGCIGLCNVRLSLPYGEFPEKSAIACFTKFGDAFEYMSGMEKSPDRPAGKQPRLFAKVFSGLPKDMTEEEFAKLGKFTTDKCFGEGPFDYATLQRYGPNAKTDWKWETMNWSLTYATSQGLKWSVVIKPVESLREDSVRQTYGNSNVKFRYVIYGVVWADEKGPIPKVVK